MNDVKSLSHSKWECKYHITWIPKYRKKKIYKELRKYLGDIFRELAKQKEGEILKGHLLPDHVHMLVSIPPKYAVAQVIGFIKGKSDIQRGVLWVARRISSASTFGHKAIMYLPRVEMRKSFANI